MGKKGTKHGERKNMVNLGIKYAVGLTRVIAIFWVDVLKVENWYGLEVIKKMLWGERCADFVLNGF